MSVDNKDEKDENVREKKADCPGCQKLREADFYNRFTPGACGPDCLIRPHRVSDEWSMVARLLAKSAQRSETVAS